MIHSRSILIRCCWLLLLGLCLCLSTSAEEPTSSALKPPAQPSPPSPLEQPVAKAPVDLFRNLLAMNPTERQQFLANRSQEAQRLILAKVREYEALKPEQRELRLRVTELRWYLMPLLRASATNRDTQLAAVPSDLRNLIEERLKEWDKLSAEQQKRFLENESAARFYFESAASMAQPTAAGAPSISQPQKLEPGLRKWQSLTDEQRQDILVNFDHFFGLTPAQREKTLRTLSEPERVQIEKTLHTFGGLTSAQRRDCLLSFGKFASLNPEERQQFLKSAARWELMTPSDREAWKHLVYNVSRQPPLPPGLRSPGPPPLPSYSVPRASSTSSILVTNAN